MEPTTVLFQERAEALDQSSHDHHARIQAQLLEGQHAPECLEPFRKPRRPHAAQGKRRGPKPAVSLYEMLQGRRGHVETEYLPQRPCKPAARHGRRIPAAHDVPNVGRVDRPAILDLDEREMSRRPQRA
jgi:hypothetical protein